MKIAFVVLAWACLTQFQVTTHGHSVVIRQASNPAQIAMQTAMNSIRSIGKTINQAIVDGNVLVHKYSDNSTDYAAEYKSANGIKINDMVVKALNETSNSSSSNGNVLACFNMQRNASMNIAQAAMENISRCGITKVRQFADIAIHLSELANATANLVPNTNASLRRCDQESNVFFRVGCISKASAEATAKGVELIVTVSTTMATATGLFATLQGDITLCTEARVMAFRKKLAEIPLTIGVCSARTVMG